MTGLVLAILLAVHQIWIRKDGLLDHRLWSQSRTPAVTIVALALDGLIFNVSMHDEEDRQTLILLGRPLPITSRNKLAFCLPKMVYLSSCSEGIAGADPISADALLF